MYSEKTLATYRAKAAAALKKWDAVPVEEIKVCISRGNKKVPCPNVSLLPVFTCPGCKHCQHECYDIRACLQYPAVMDARARNTSLVRRAPDLFWRQVRLYIARMKAEEFRFHVGGDIPDARYFRAMKDTTRLFPFVGFWSYTKSDDIVNADPEKDPDNLSLMRSPWPGTACNNAAGRPEYVCRFPDPARDVYPPEWFDTHYHCPGDCSVCLRNHRGCPSGESAWTWLHR